VISNIGRSQIASGEIAINNIAHNIANVDNASGKTLSTTFIETQQGVKAETRLIDRNPSLIREILQMIETKLYTKAGIKVIQTADELMGYILDIKA